MNLIPTLSIALAAVMLLIFEADSRSIDYAFTPISMKVGPIYVSTARIVAFGVTVVISFLGMLVMGVSFIQGLAVIASLPCEIIVTPHPSASDLFPRLSGSQPLVKPAACTAYAAAASKRFAERLARETVTPK